VKEQKEHLIQLRIKSGMNLETLIKNFPVTILVRNSDAEPMKSGAHQLEVVYVNKVIKVAEAI
jgi:hypothetical protein